ncbi:hypothetical protein MTR_6g052450 [Medicago truncatula]|uniref:Uncharacterized protein n=1 Tax=Medicago truncatula TaxID=3880 RepID=G7KLH2_MEDTR|nr:hypothetical protein MTR_6g052450 [Medicago truncatula]
MLSLSNSPLLIAKPYQQINISNKRSIVVQDLYPRVWKTNKKIGTISKAAKLVQSIAKTLPYKEVTASFGETMADIPSLFICELVFWGGLFLLVKVIKIDVFVESWVTEKLLIGSIKIHDRVVKYRPYWIAVLDILTTSMRNL